MKERKTGVIRKAAQILIEGLEQRFPITNATIAAALLDPCVQHIEVVREWLLDNNKTRYEVLTEAMEDFNIDSNIEPQQQQKQNQNCISSNNIRLLLSKKHSVFSNTSFTGLELEIANFVILKDEVPDVLSFWRSQEINFPVMAKLAKVILSKPATSAKSESAFSVAGVLLSKKRAHIEPLRAEKILFIHDNYDLCKDAI